jgi:hypothetical protein
VEKEECASNRESNTNTLVSGPIGASSRTKCEVGTNVCVRCWPWMANSRTKCEVGTNVCVRCWPWMASL